MEWKKDYEEALQYTKAATGMVENKKVDNETLYHIICLAIEKYTATLTSILNYIPMHSGLNFIFRELNKKMDLPDHFIDEVRFINGFMSYCSLEFEKPKKVTNEDLSRMVAFLNELKIFTDEKLVAENQDIS